MNCPYERKELKPNHHLHTVPIKGHYQGLYIWGKKKIDVKTAFCLFRNYIQLVKEITQKIAQVWGSGSKLNVWDRV